MPDPSNYDNEDDWMAACMSTMMDEGKPQDQAVAACMQMWRDRDKSAAAQVTRAWSTLTVKSIDAEQRTIEGIATTPSVDRIGDIVEPLGAKFTLPLPLLHHHKHDHPVGHVIAAKATKDGLSIKARLAKIAEPGALKDRVDTAWQELKAGLVRGLSIGFKPITYEFLDDKSGGLRFSEWSLHEVSLVTIPANADAQITLIKSIDQGLQAADGQAEASGSRASGAAQETRESSLPGSRGKSVQLKRKEREMTVTEQLKAFEDERAAKAARRIALMEESAKKGETLDDEQGEEYETLDREIKAIDKHLTRLRALEVELQAKAQPVVAKTVEQGSEARSGAAQIRVRDPQMPPGVRMARVAKCLAAAQGNRAEAYRIGQRMYASDAPTLATLEAAMNYGEVSDLAVKAAVPAGAVGDTQWAGALVQAASGESGVVGDFLEYLRPLTILGQFGTNGIPALRSVPFRTGLITQMSEGTGYWVGEGAAKPVTKVDLSRRTLAPLKVANIAVVTEELMRDSSPSADVIVRDSLVNALRTRLDTDFIDPAKAASAGISPASITNGVTAQTSFSAGGSTGGGPALAIRRDINRAVDAFIDANLATDSLVWVMRANTGMKLSMIINSLGEPDALFANVNARGGTLAGIPVITSQFVPATGSPTGDYVVLMDAQSVWFADEGGFAIDFSREATVEMDSVPQAVANTGVSPGTASPSAVTAASANLVSLWQENLIGWRAERTVNWLRARPNAVVVIESVNWGE